MAKAADIPTRAGSRIRERRHAAGISQAELARRVGISGSYLNLIEHNRRRIGGKLMLDIAQALQIAPQFLSEGAEIARVEALRTLASRASGTSEIAIDIDVAPELAERFPGWAALLLDQAARIERLEATVAKLSDRLAHDPHLAQSLHEILSTVTAIRSSAAILKDTADLEPQWRERFQRNLFEESERLVAGSQRLAGYLDSSASEEPLVRAPRDEVQAFLRSHNFRFPDFERSQMPDPREIVAESGLLTSAPARTLAVAHLERSRAEAALLPADQLSRELAAREGDPVRVASELRLPLGLVLRRIAVLPAAGAPEAGLTICDGSGTLTYAKPAEGFDISLLGHACPLWPLYEALQRPMVPVARDVSLPGEVGGGFRTWSVAEQTWPEGLDGPAVVEATMLILPSRDPPDTALALGIACAICPRDRCPARHEPSIFAAGL